MILNDEDLKERIESPANLLNRLRTTLSRSNPSNLPVINPSTGIPCLPPKSDDIIPNLSDKIKETAVRGKAIGILSDAMDEIKLRMSEMKPEKLAYVCDAMARVITRHEESRMNSSNTSQIIIYAPQVQNIENYEVVEVVE